MRQRTAPALSQILVVSGTQIKQPCTMANNDKPNPVKGIEPN